MSDPTAVGAAAHADLAATPGLRMTGEENVVILLYPGFTALDVTGPHYFLASMMGARVHLLSTGADLAPVPSDLGLAVAPTGLLADRPDRVDVLLVPGGSQGSAEALADRRVMGWLRDTGTDTGADAGLVCGVCTGSLLLGAAGLLTGRRATAHWVVRHLLTECGATPVNERVVTDGRVVTAAGVTAGIDLALQVVARLRGEPYARAVQLQGEYAPEPPYATGTPAGAGPQLTGQLRGIFAPLVAAFTAALEERSAAGAEAP